MKGTWQVVATAHGIPKKVQEGKLFPLSSWYLTSLIANSLSSQGSETGFTVKETTWTYKLSGMPASGEGQTGRTDGRQRHSIWPTDKLEAQQIKLHSLPSRRPLSAPPPSSSSVHVGMPGQSGTPDQTQPSPASTGEQAACSVMPILWKLFSNEEGISYHT